ncbi:MAG: tetratricopeptide repeat protein [Candidatus Hodarchaeales archaeon]|jgi:tetratricopeptide (TPR) repeat protein
MLDNRLTKSSKYQGYLEALNNSLVKPEIITQLYTEKPTEFEEKITLLILQGYFEKKHKKNFSKALSIFNKFFEIYDNISDYPFHLLAGLNIIIDIKLFLGNVSNVKPLLVKADKLINSLKAEGMLEAELGAVRNWVNYYWHKGQYKDALEKTNFGLTIIKFHPIKERKKLWEIRFLYIRAILNFHLGEYQESIVNTMRSLASVRELKDESIQQFWFDKFLNIQCLVYRTLGEFELASEYAEQIRETIKKKPQLDRFLLSDLCSNLGMFELEQGNYLSAFEYLNKALEIQQKNGSIFKQAISLGNIARILAISGDSLKAKETFRSSANIFEKCRSEIEIIEKYCWYADSLIFKNSLIEAQDLLQTTQSLADKHGSKREQILVATRYAKWLKATKKSDVSRLAFIEVRREAELIGQSREMVQSSIYLAELALERVLEIGIDKGLFDEAFKNVERSIYLASKSSQIVHLVRAMQIKATLLGLKFEFAESLYVLDDAISIAEEKGLFRQQGQLYSLKLQLEQRRKLFSRSEEGIPSVGSSELLSALRLTTGRNPLLGEKINGNIISFQDVLLFYMGIFVFDRAQLLVYSFDPLPIYFISQKEFFDPMTMGLMFSTSLGQGTRYNEGLYGPLPTPDVQDFRSVVFSKQLEQPTDSNPSGKYILIALNYHCDFDPLFYNRHEFEKYFNRTLKIDKLESLTSEFINEIKTGINNLVSREIDHILSKS